MSSNLQATSLSSIWTATLFFPLQYLYLILLLLLVVTPIPSCRAEGTYTTTTTSVPHQSRDIIFLCQTSTCEEAPSLASIILQASSSNSSSSSNATDAAEHSLLLPVGNLSSSSSSSLHQRLPSPPTVLVMPLGSYCQPPIRTSAATTSSNTDLHDGDDDDDDVEAMTLKAIQQGTKPNSIVIAREQCVPPALWGHPQFPSSDRLFIILPSSNRRKVQTPLPPEEREGDWRVGIHVLEPDLPLLGFFAATLVCDYAKNIILLREEAAAAAAAMATSSTTPAPSPPSSTTPMSPSNSSSERILLFFLSENTVWNRLLRFGFNIGIESAGCGVNATASIFSSSTSTSSEKKIFNAGSYIDVPVMLSNSIKTRSTIVDSVDAAASPSTTTNHSTSNGSSTGTTSPSKSSQEGVISEETMSKFISSILRHVDVSQLPSQQHSAPFTRTIVVTPDLPLQILMEKLANETTSSSSSYVTTTSTTTVSSNGGNSSSESSSFFYQNSTYWTKLWPSASMGILKPISIFYNHHTTTVSLGLHQAILDLLANWNETEQACLKPSESQERKSESSISSLSSSENSLDDTQNHQNNQTRCFHAAFSSHQFNHLATIPTAFAPFLSYSAQQHVKSLMNHRLSLVSNLLKMGNFHGTEWHRHQQQERLMATMEPLTGLNTTSALHLDAGRRCPHVTDTQGSTPEMSIFDRYDASPTHFVFDPVSRSLDETHVEHSVSPNVLGAALCKLQGYVFEYGGVLTNGTWSSVFSISVVNRTTNTLQSVYVYDSLQPFKSRVSGMPGRLAEASLSCVLMPNFIPTRQHRLFTTTTTGAPGQQLNSTSASPSLSSSSSTSTSTSTASRNRLDLVGGRGKLLLCSGVRDDLILSTELWEFDLLTFTWTLLSASAPSRTKHTGVVWEISDVDDPLADFVTRNEPSFYDPSTGSGTTTTILSSYIDDDENWKHPTLASFETANSRRKVTDWQWLVIVGGQDHFSPVMWAINAKQWVSLPSSADISPRVNPNVVSTGRFIIVIGGKLEFKRLKDVYIFDERNREWSKTTGLGQTHFWKGGTASSLLQQAQREVMMRSTSRALTVVNSFAIRLLIPRDAMNFSSVVTTTANQPTHSDNFVLSYYLSPIHHAGCSVGEIQVLGDQQCKRCEAGSYPHYGRCVLCSSIDQEQRSLPYRVKETCFPEHRVTGLVLFLLLMFLHVIIPVFVILFFHFQRRFETAERSEIAAIELAAAVAQMKFDSISYLYTQKSKTRIEAAVVACVKNFQFYRSILPNTVMVSLDCEKNPDDFFFAKNEQTNNNLSQENTAAAAAGNHAKYISTTTTRNAAPPQGTHHQQRYGSQQQVSSIQSPVGTVSSFPSLVGTINDSRPRRSLHETQLRSLFEDTLMDDYAVASEYRTAISGNSRLQSMLGAARDDATMSTQHFLHSSFHAGGTVATSMNQQRPSGHVSPPFQRRQYLKSLRSTNKTHNIHFVHISNNAFHQIHTRTVEFLAIKITNIEEWRCKQPPEKVAARLAKFHDAMLAVVLRFQGVLESITGDLLIASWNAVGEPVEEPLPMVALAGQAACHSVVADKLGIRVVAGAAAGLAHVGFAGTEIICTHVVSSPAIADAVTLANYGISVNAKGTIVPWTWEEILAAGFVVRMKHFVQIFPTNRKILAAEIFGPPVGDRRWLFELRGWKEHVALYNHTMYNVQNGQLALASEANLDDLPGIFADELRKVLVSGKLPVSPIVKPW